MLLLKELFYFLILFSAVGLFFLFKNKSNCAYILVVVLISSIAWREFGLNKSSRYYSLFVAISLFIAAYGASAFIKSFHRPFDKRLVSFIIFVLLLLVHIQKSFSSFKNTFIIDLNESISSQIHKDKKNIVYIYDKEIVRLGHAFSDSIQVRPISSETQWDLTEFCNWNGFYSNTIYFVFPEKTGSPIISSNIPQLDVFRNECRKIEHFFTNRERTKFVSVYRHLPFTPLPKIREKTLLEGANLMAYIPEYDTYIFQKNNQFVWFIGTRADVKNNTEIIYHVYTDETDLLPEKHQKSGFENKSLRIYDKDRIELDSGYYVLAKDIPVEYPVSKIRCGFFTEGNLTLTRFIPIRNEDI